MSERISLRDRLLGTKAGKQQWHDYTRRRDALPPDYRVVMKEIEQFMYRTAIEELYKMYYWTEMIYLKSSKGR